jgi:hypothetical protein
MEIAIALGVFTAGMFLSENDDKKPFLLPRPTTNEPSQPCVQEIPNPFSGNPFSHVAPLYRGFEPLGNMNDNNHLSRLEGDDVPQKRELKAGVFNMDIPTVPRNQVSMGCDIERAQQGLKKTTDVKPFEPEMVSFGTYDRIMPKGVDELRTLNNPKVVYNQPSQHGFRSEIGHLPSCNPINPYEITSENRDLFKSTMPAQAEIRQNVPTHRSIDSTLQTDVRLSNAQSPSMLVNTCSAQQAHAGSYYSNITKRGTLTAEQEAQARTRIGGADVIGTPNCNLERTRKVESSIVLASSDIITKDVTDGQISFGVAKSSMNPEIEIKGRMIHEGRLGLSSILKSLGLEGPETYQTNDYQGTVYTPSLGVASLQKATSKNRDAQMKNNPNSLHVENHTGNTSTLRRVGLQTPEAEQTRSYSENIHEPVLGLATLNKADSKIRDAQMFNHANTLHVENHTGNTSTLRRVGLQTPEAEQTRSYSENVHEPVLGLATMRTADSKIREAQMDNKFNQLHVVNYTSSGGAQVGGTMTRAMDINLKESLDVTPVSNAAPLINTKGPILNNVGLREENTANDRMSIKNMSHIQTDSSSLTSYNIPVYNEEISIMLGERTTSISNIRGDGPIRPELTHPDTFNCN